MTGRGQPKRKRKQRFHMTFNFPVLSANRLWITKGRRRFPSGDYTKFKKLFFSHLVNNGYTKGCLNLSGNLKVSMDIGFSNRRSDLDNGIKAVLDCLVSFFGKWDDSQVAEINMRKFIVPKGEEYFTVLITKTRRKL